MFDGLVHYLDIPRTRQYDAGTIRCVAKNSLGQTESVATLDLRLRQDYRTGLSKVPGGIETGLDDSFDIDIEERLKLRSQLRQRGSGALRSCISLNVYFHFLVDDRARRPSTDKLYPLQSKAQDRVTWRQTEEKVGDAPNFTKPLLPLKAKGLFHTADAFNGHPILLLDLQRIPKSSLAWSSPVLHHRRCRGTAMDSWWKIPRTLKFKQHRHRVC